LLELIPDNADIAITSESGASVYPELDDIAISKDNRMVYIKGPDADGVEILVQRGEATKLRPKG
jgi:hypothetical protein